MAHQGHQKRRGIALATTLLLMVVLLILGVGFLAAAERDLRFQRRQQVSNQALLLAQSGIEYYRYLTHQTSSAAPPVGTPLPIDVSDDERIILETLQTGATYTYTSKGQVLRSDNSVLSERTYVVFGESLSANGQVYDSDL